MKRQSMKHLETVKGSRHTINEIAKAILRVTMIKPKIHTKYRKYKIICEDNPSLWGLTFIATRYSEEYKCFYGRITEKYWLREFHFKQNELEMIDA